MRKSLAVLMSVAVLASLAAGPLAAVAEADYSVAWVNQGATVQRWAYNGRLYAHWECDVAGTVVAAGIFWVWLTPPSAVVGALAGAAFTAGCHVGAPDVSYYMNGVPYEASNTCFMVYPYGHYYQRRINCIL